MIESMKQAVRDYVEKHLFRNSKGKYTEIKGLQPLKETAPRHEFVFVPRKKEGSDKNVAETEKRTRS